MVPKHGNLIEVFRTEEKGSDVNLAVHLVNDVHQNTFDCAVVISNDSDLAKAMRIVKDEYRKSQVFSLLGEGMHQSTL